MKRIFVFVLVSIVLFGLASAQERTIPSRTPTIQEPSTTTNTSNIQTTQPTVQTAPAPATVSPTNTISAPQPGASETPTAPTSVSNPTTSGRNTTAQPVQPSAAPPSSTQTPTTATQQPGTSTTPTSPVPASNPTNSGRNTTAQPVQPSAAPPSSMQTPTTATQQPGTSTTPTSPVPASNPTNSGRTTTAQPAQPSSIKSGSSVHKPGTSAIPAGAATAADPSKKSQGAAGRVGEQSQQIGSPANKQKSMVSFGKQSPNAESEKELSNMLKPKAGISSKQPGGKTIKKIEEDFSSTEKEINESTGSNGREDSRNNQNTKAGSQTTPGLAPELLKNKTEYSKIGEELNKPAVQMEQGEAINQDKEGRKGEKSKPAVQAQKQNTNAKTGKAIKTIQPELSDKTKKKLDL